MAKLIGREIGQGQIPRLVVLLRLPTTVCVRESRIEDFVHFQNPFATNLAYQQSISHDLCLSQSKISPENKTPCC